MREEGKNFAKGTNLTEKNRRGRIYPRLAVSGIMKNGRIYGPYLLTCMGMVMMYYILRFLMESERIASMKGGGTLQSMLSLGSGVFAVFVVIFLFYTHSFLMKSRKREFGLYNVLGMGKWNLARILVWENVIMAFFSLAGGLLCGILFSKLAELLMARILDGQVSMSFDVPLSEVGAAAALFAGVFALLLLHSLIQVGKANPIDLLHSEAVGEKPPKANWVLAVFGVVILAAAYYMAVTIEDPVSALTVFFLAVAMVIAATYLLFIAGSVVLCRILQKNKGYYYKANHFVSVSSMMYRMKRNGAGLASICILSTMVLVMLSSTTCMYVGSEDRLNTRYPRQIELYQQDSSEEEWGLVRKTVNKTLKNADVEMENRLSYRYLAVGAYADSDQMILDTDQSMTSSGFYDYSKIWQLYFMSLEDYNQITGNAETLEAGEVLVYLSRGEYGYDSITVEGCDTWKVKKQVEEFRDNGQAVFTTVTSLYVFVPDETALETVDQAQKAIYGENASSVTRYLGFDTSVPEEGQQEIADTLREKLDRKQTEGKIPFTDLDCRAAKRGDFYALYSGLFVLGILLGVVFLVATVLIMYYKQVTEGYEDQAKFDIMQRVGMTKKEIRRSIRSQMFTVFLLPLLLSGVHTVFAFPIVRKLLLLLGVTNTRLLILTNIGCFLIFALFYMFVYHLTSRAYYRIVSGGRE